MNSELKEDLKKLEKLPREDYMEIYKFLGDKMWEYAKTPTVGDIADFVEGINNDTISDVIDFTGKEKMLRELVQKDNSVYSEQESDQFMNEVISSHNTDISDSGYFYKKLMASCDDIRIKDDDCGSTGIAIRIKDIDEDYYNFKVRFSYVEHIEDYAKDMYDDFMNKLAELGLTNDDCILIRTPSSCNHAKNRCLCNKCAGIIKRNHYDFFTPKNIGVFTTLMITEQATQGALSSMNNGTSTNMNNVLDQKFNKPSMTWEEVQNEVQRIVDEIGDIGVQARFYEIALISRVYKTNKDDNLYLSVSFKNSLMHNKNALLGKFIYSPTRKNFDDLIKTKAFVDDSLKARIMFDKYD